jgi:glyoxylase-like metal-dependent hydrolase (beta-lactamase superfamily II)
MEVKQLVNSVFTSNTYIVSDNNSDWVWLIDVGDIKGVLNSLTKGTYVKGVFITHPHFDHIYGINKLVDLFPECLVFTSEDGKQGLFSDKLNLSYYHNDPITFLGSNIQILRENDTIELFENYFLEALETPGHNWGCLTYKIGNYLFTGDSYIPNVPVVTKLKGGDRESNKKSLQKIKDNISENTIICPGHGEMTKSIK